MKCVFCEILSNKKERIIRETKNTVTILSNPYLLKGHCLIIPKKHYKSILEIPDEILCELIKEVRAVEKILLEKFRASGCDIRQHYRPFQKESLLKIDHLHFHVIPRELEDELYKKSMIFEKEVFKELDEETLKEVSQKIR
jgi:histidine triad (HIT) family protein